MPFVEGPKDDIFTARHSWILGVIGIAAWIGLLYLMLRD